MRRSKERARTLMIGGLMLSWFIFLTGYAFAQASSPISGSTSQPSSTPPAVSTAGASGTTALPVTPGNFLYHYQNLITGVLALLVGGLTIQVMLRQLNHDRQIRRESSISVTCMFYEELKMYAKFTLEVYPQLIKAISSKRPISGQGIYPERVVFNSQAARFSEMSPNTALSLMYFYQSLTTLQTAIKDDGIMISDLEAGVLKETVDILVANTRTALQHIIKDLRTYKVGIGPGDIELLTKIEKLHERIKTQT